MNCSDAARRRSRVRRGMGAAACAGAVMLALLASLPGAAKAADEAAQAATIRPNAAAAFDAFKREDYLQAIRLGAATLVRTPDNVDLRLMVANSLAWTGRYEAAVSQYEKLYGTRLETAGRIGIGNTLRWRGMPEQALAMHQQALRLSPADRDAERALYLTNRDLRPTTTVRYAHFDDNQNYRRNETLLTHRFWSQDRSARMDIGVAAGREGADGIVSTSDVSASLYLPRPIVSTRIEAWSANDSHTRVYGRLSADFAGDQAGVRFGRVNWGRMANNQRALADGLTANQAGGHWNLRTGWGTWRGRADVYSISDGNRLYDAETSFKPYWQPLPLGLYVQAGLYTRKAERADPRYWSPDKAYSLSTFAIGRNWWGERSDFTLLLQRGFALNTDSKSNMSVAGTARYWAAASTAIGMELYLSDAPRASAYKSNSIAATVQHVW